MLYNIKFYHINIITNFLLKIRLRLNKNEIYNINNEKNILLMSVQLGIFELSYCKSNNINGLPNVEQIIYLLYHFI